MLHSVASRVLIVTALGAGAIAATLALFFIANDRLRDANQQSQHASAVNTAAYDVRAQVVDLDNSFEEVIATGKPRFVARWHSATRSWRGSAATLERLAAGDADQEQRAQQLYADIEAYVSDYGNPVIAIAKISPSAARSSTATQEGTLRINNILTAANLIVAYAQADVENETSDANLLATRATDAGIAALVLTPLLLILLGISLSRSVAKPLVRTVDAATSVAAGRFDVRLDERRKDEFGTLARAFNSMTVSLAATRDELVSRAERLERAERHKSDLISMVSHEVRTPLSSVLGFTRLLLERGLSEEDRSRYLRIIDAEATRLADLVSDFLDSRLIEEGRFSLHPEPFDLRALLLTQTEVALAHDTRHRLHLEVDDAPLEIIADRRRLAQVLGNMLSNAVKYSPEGGTVTVGAERDDETVRVHVDDEGTGIAPQHRDQIFEPFFRGGASDLGIPGTGLGLSVSRRIVEAHGGRMDFEPLEPGTRFWIEVPVDGIPAESEPPGAEAVEEPSAAEPAHEPEVAPRALRVSPSQRG